MCDQMVLELTAALSEKFHKTSPVVSANDVLILLQELNARISKLNGCLTGVDASTIARISKSLQDVEVYIHSLPVPDRESLKFETGIIKDRISLLSEGPKQSVV